MNSTHKILPFFPLSVFLLPGEDIPLQIFEPRYLQLIEEARDPGYTFVIPFQKNDAVMEFGCEVKLQQVLAESKQGKKVITVEAISVVRIKSYTEQMSGKLYGGGTVEVLPSNEPIMSPSLSDLIGSYFSQYESHNSDKIDLNNLKYFDVIRTLNLSSDDKYNFVSMTTTEQRDRFLRRQIEYLSLIRYQERMLNDDFRLN